MEIMGSGSHREDRLTREIIYCVLRVHTALGPGFLERIYRRALLIDLRDRHLAAETEKEISIYYHGQIIGSHHLDILVEGEVILELKSVEALGKAHYAQVRSYLKAAQLRRALLINFATPSADIRRIESPQQSP